VSIQESDTAVEEFVAKYGLNYQFLMDRTGQTSTTYKITSTPTTYFIAPDGTIVDSTTGVVSQAWLEKNLDNFIAT